MMTTTPKSFFLVLFSFISFFIGAQEGGMWIPNELNEKEMRKMGLKISTKKIFDADNPSIKDAIARFGSGCTAGIISSKGLLLTNHHCGYYNIQSHSTVDNDLLSSGFWAKGFNEELPNEGLNVTFVTDIKEVTHQVLQGVTEKMNENERKNLIEINIRNISTSISKESYQDINIHSFYNGNKYYAIITETFEDVRLVGAPPSSIGKFGADTDNWMWPRHTGDFALFRVYSDKNNRPAKYSKDNIPYTPKYYLPISIKEKKENDFSWVYGFPALTEEYLPAAALEQIIETINPARISLREEVLKILDQRMQTNQETKIKYASKYATIANGWKKWKGENQGLIRTNAVSKKKEQEIRFTEFSQSNPDKQNEYRNILPDLNRTYKENDRYVKAFIYFNEAFYLNSETFKMAIWLSNLLDEYNNPNFENLKKATLRNISRLYRNYDPELDREISAKMLSMYSLNIEPMFQVAGHENYERLDAALFHLQNLWDNSYITNKKGDIISLLSSSDEDIINALKEDAVINFIRPYFGVYTKRVSPNYQFSQNKLDSLQRIYMKGQLIAFPENNFFPDANSTLRVTYGKVKGYQPKDGVFYEPFTTLKGVMEKYIPNDYEFDLDNKLINLYYDKNYGDYSQGDKMIVNYIATNHTTGGNSGSPALDSHGDLVGINFDRTWEGTMSDLSYDPSICRNIMVDIRYILFIIDKYAESNHIIDEIKIKR